jgi:acyl-CoA synthetase (AMP-forming)/AMP-acid ligase II
MIEDVHGLWELVERRAALTPDALMAVDEDRRSMTFAELRDRSVRVAAGLHAGFDVGPGDPVSWLLPTWIESIVLVGALARLGVVQNPLLPIYREREVRFMVGQTHAKLLVTPSVWRGFDYAAMATAIAADLPGLQTLVCDKHLPEGDPSGLVPAPAPVTDPDTAPVRWVFYTSGTTADPKGARHTDPNVRAAAVVMVDGLEITESDRAAMVFPFTHIGGQAWLFLSLMTGARLVLAESFVPAVTIPILQREGITLGNAGTPFHMAYLAAQRADPTVRLFPDARVYPGGASPKPPQLHYEVKEELGGVGIVSGYGLTEAPILTMAHLDDPDDQLADTEGRPGPGVELRIVTLDGEVAGVDEEGEIRAKAPQVLKGYVDSSLDADAFDGDGWFRTGDLGRINAHGNVVITGRLKDVIIRKGENISAKEVEDALFTHPKIADAAVIGLRDPRSGERACAVVVPADEGPPTLEELFEFLTAGGLMVHKVPEQLEIVDELPRNPSGKVLKHELRAKYSDTP